MQRALGDDGTPVKEYEIGLAVLGKLESWDPRTDPHVRVEFGRVRQKLAEYYQGEGSGDSILIEFPSRGYVPAFRRAEPSEPAAAPPEPASAAEPAPRRRWIFAFALISIALGAVLFGAWRGMRPLPITTVAVLPFMDLTAGASHGYLADGIAEELTNSLAMLKGLRVVARTSAFQFKGKNADVREIGRQLGAGAVVEGSVLGDGEHLRVIVQLNRTADGTHLWQAQYDRESKDLLAIENDVAQAVAGALRVRLVGPAPAAFDPGRQALDEYLKGFDEERKSDPASLQQAEAHYRNALRLAPGYAMAHVRLGSLNLAKSAQTGPAQLAALENAQREFETAVSLQPNLPIAVSALALVDYVLNWDWPSAEAKFRRALELGPSSTAHQTYAWALMTRGRFAESERHYREAIQLDPLNCLFRYNLAVLFSREQRPDLARQELGSCLARNPGWFLGRMELGYLDLYANSPQQGLRDLQAAEALAPESPVLLPGFAIAEVEAGHRDRAAALLHRMEQDAGKKDYVRYQLAMVSAYLGDRDRLFDWLTQSVAAHEQHAMNMRVDPVFAPYQKDERMMALERRVGLIP